MKNLAKIVGIIALGALAAFPLAAFGSSEESASSAKASGTLTITGLEWLDGYYISAVGLGANGKSYSAAALIDPESYQHPSLKPEPQATGGVIKNESVTLPIWEFEKTSSEDLGEVFHHKFKTAPFNGNGTVEFSVIIWEGSEIYFWQSCQIYMDAVISVTFKNGKAEFNWKTLFEHTGEK